jgi:alkylation response protein AidB-like acyl-CoA dehydrogenase
MNFGISEEQEMLQETVRSFAENECPATRLREIFDGDEGHDPNHWNGLVEMGIGGLAIPEQYGGAGLELIDLALVAEVLGAYAMPGPFLGHSLAGLAIALGGSEEQKERWLPRLASGDVLGTVALGEDGSQWEPESAKLTVESGQVSGAKSFVPNGALADLVVVGLAGGRLGLVETTATGVSFQDTEGVDRSRRLDRLTLDQAPCEELAKAVGPRVRDAGLVLLAADSFGGAWKLVEMSTEYAKTRKQFGQIIGQFQAVKHKLSDMVLEVEPCRGLYWYAAHAFDHLPEDSERAAALAKSHVSERYMSVARDAVEVHGGIGFTWECDVQMWFKRAIFNRTFLGDTMSQRRRLAKLKGWQSQEASA